ncbi:MAG TPA: ATP-binding protein [Tepidisphaeraceae bacterium]|nr:ATP-binding protein [Tepidisphaeraceae bacterium]
MLQLKPGETLDTLRSKIDWLANAPPAAADEPAARTAPRPLRPTMNEAFLRSVLGSAPPTENDEKIAAERGRAINASMLARGVPERYLSIDLEQLDRDLPPDYLAAARKLSDIAGSPFFLAIGGSRGIGKTALASGLIRAYTVRGRHAFYTTARRMIDELTTADWDRKMAVRRKFERAHLLVIDEVQDRSATPREDAVFGDLLDHRYGNELATLMITNLSSEALAADMGGKLLRRMGEEGGYQLCEWPMIVPFLAARKAAQHAAR